MSYAELLHRNGLDRIEASGDATPGDEEEKFSSYGFGAVFAEVRVDPDLGTMRVPRIIGAYDVDRVVSPKLARTPPSMAPTSTSTAGMCRRWRRVTFLAMSRWVRSSRSDVMSRS
jgi:hypothetical protein